MQMRTKLLVVVVALGVAAAVQAGAPRVLLHPDANAWTPFVEGDELVAVSGGQVEWYRDGRLVATVSDPQGLASENYDSATQLFVVDAEGNRVIAVVPGMALFLTAEPQAIVLHKKDAHSLTRRGSNMTYHNGPVLLANKTKAIFWGHSWPTYSGDIISGIDSFFGGFGNSNYAGITTQYYQISGGSQQFIGAGSTYLGHYIDGTTAPSNALSTSQVIAEACSATGNSPDPSALYLVYTDTTAGNANYCAYHTWGTCSNGKQVQAAYMPNITGVAGCDPGNNYNLSGSEGLRALANVTAHELSEAITDPRGSAWYDRQGAEIGDKCAWIFSGPVTLSNGSVWQLQEEWSNAVTGCAQGQ
jgi:hypothetical protein